ncbi:MAG: hypothetical protein ACJ0DJ_05430 [bacterium]
MKYRPHNFTSLPLCTTPLSGKSGEIVPENCLHNFSFKIDA